MIYHFQVLHSVTVHLLQEPSKLITARGALGAAGEQAQDCTITQSVRGPHESKWQSQSSDKFSLAGCKWLGSLEGGGNCELNLKSKTQSGVNAAATAPPLIPRRGVNHILVYWTASLPRLSLFVRAHVHHKGPSAEMGRVSKCRVHSLIPAAAWWVKTEGTVYSKLSLLLFEPSQS